MYDNDELDRLKRETSILSVAERYGVHAERKGRTFMALCPFHDDHNPSLSLDPIRNTFKCFGCGKSGSVIDFVMEKEGIPFRDAVDSIAKRYGRDLASRNEAKRSGNRIAGSGAVCRASELHKPKADQQPHPAASLSPDEMKTVTDVLDYYHRTLSGPDTTAIDYLKRRQIADPETLKAFKVGYCNGTLNKVLPEEAIPVLKKVGILRKDGTEFFAGCVVVPILCEDGTLGELYGRRLTNGNLSASNGQAGGASHLYLPGPHRGVLNVRAAQVHSDEIILTEAVFDALTFYAHGIRNVLACYGTNGFTDDHLALLSSNDVRKVVIAFDADKPGDTAANTLAGKLTAQDIDCHRCYVSQIDKPDGGKVKDVNEYVGELYRQGMPKKDVIDCLGQIVSKARRFGHKRPRKEPGGLALSEQNVNELIFSNCELAYRLRGLFDNGTTSLRLVVAATRHSGQVRDDSSAGSGQGKTHTDRFDLYTARSRKSFAYRAAEQLGLPSVRIEQDLDKLIPVLETILAENKSQREDDDTPCVPPMSEADRKDALALLRSPRLLETIVTDIEIVGFVGEEQPKLLTYLIATSRKLAKPLSTIIRSESGAGKSFLMECVADMMPPEDVKYFSRLTPQSLYYMGRDELVHKLLIVDERDGSEEAEYPIRTLQTRRVLTLAVPVKDPAKGTTKTKCIEILGPLSFMESTTSTVINPENANRNFEIYLDESEEQTRRIYEAQRKAHTLEGWKNEERRFRTIQRHHNAQRLLEAVRVLIPYTELIHFPESWTRGRRDHERMLYLVEAIAFLHQHQRERRNDPKKGEYIEATVDDYAQAYSLARTALGQALCDIPRTARQMLSQIKVMVKEWSERLGVAEKDYGFRQRDVREYTKLPHYVVKRAVRSLEELEYIRVRSGGHGRAKVYSLTKCHEDDDPLKGLTTPEELEKLWKNTEPGQNRDK